MALQVILYSFAKKNNSTARPAGGTTFNDCVLKNETDILNPTIIIAGYDVNKKLNYAYIPAFSRYYYVQSITWVQGTWRISLSIDVLASWKAEIGAHELYVTRASAIFNGDLMDNTYPAKSEPDFETVIKNTFWETTDLTDGMFVVGVAGQNTTYYKFSYNSLQLFLQYILGELYVQELTDTWSSIFSSLSWQANALQYIVSINWFPFSVNTSGVDSIRVGFVDVPVDAGLVNGSGMVFFTHSFSPPRHPQASTRGQYLNNAPYGDYNLFYPPFGQMQLDPNMVANTFEIETLVGVDLRTGKGTLTILDNTNTVVASWIHSQISIPYQTSQIMAQGDFDISKIVGFAGSMAPAMATGDISGMATGLVAGGINAIGDYAKGKIPSSRTIGSVGGMNSLRGNVAMQCEFKIIADEDNDHRGRPLCTNKVLNTLSGYILVSNPDISIHCTERETEQIKSYLAGGFYYE